ncbi:hypothetical protein K2173_025670 [Erythroxylum novogranatense]|uniref:Uncharacterized protein n=1 Tax=Erythroxylum novogranatense TaxID=1862640 RepID=A0AAV8SBX4_9ROSI|nr:hypothetical protein K2173_025670 [Erythroxylum novogranatense]
MTATTLGPEARPHNTEGIEALELEEGPPDILPSAPPDNPMAPLGPADTTALGLSVDMLTAPPDGESLADSIGSLEEAQRNQDRNQLCEIDRSQREAHTGVKLEEAGEQVREREVKKKQ